MQVWNTRRQMMMDVYQVDYIEDIGSAIDRGAVIIARENREKERRLSNKDINNLRYPQNNISPS